MTYLLVGVVVGLILGIPVGMRLAGASRSTVRPAPAAAESAEMPAAVPPPPPASSAPAPFPEEIRRSGPPLSGLPPAEAPAEGISLLDQMLQEAPETIRADLRQNLRVKCLYDDAAVDRLIAHEREQDPGGDEIGWMRAAVRRWENNNR